MTKRSNRQCTVEMAKWKNALVLHDRIVETPLALGTDYQDCRLNDNVLYVNDRVVENVATGVISSDVNQDDAVIAVHDALWRAIEFNRFMCRIFSYKRANDLRKKA